MSYLRALADRLRAGQAPVPLVRPADAVATVAEVEPPEEPAAGPAATGPAPPRSRPPQRRPAARPGPAQPPATTPAVAQPPARAAGERVERYVAERVREVHHEHHTHHQVVRERPAEPAGAPTPGGPPPIVHPLVREVRPAPPAPATPPVPAAAATDRPLPLAAGPPPAPAEPAAPTVHVHIGRVVVRTDPPAEQPRTPAASPPPPVGLAEYLAGREPGPP